MSFAPGLRLPEDCDNDDDHDNDDGSDDDDHGLSLFYLRRFYLPPVLPTTSR